MSASHRLPTEAELGLHRLVSASGIEIGVLPGGSLFAIQHVQAGEQMLINQVFGSPLGSGIGRILLRRRGAAVIEATGPGMRGRITSLLMLNPGLISVGALIAGPLAELLGVRGASLALAGTATTAVLLLYFLSPVLREMKIQ